jgi:hypothetical protein
MCLALQNIQKRVVTLRDSPCGDTSNAATVAVMTFVTIKSSATSLRAFEFW